MPTNGSPPNMTMTPRDQSKAKPNDSTGRGPATVTSRTQSEPVHTQVSFRVALAPGKSLEPPCSTMRCRNRSVAKPNDQRGAGECVGASRCQVVPSHDHVSLKTFSVPLPLPPPN